MTESKENLNMLLGRHGYKNTKSRRAIIAILEEAEIPLTADEIFLGITNSGTPTNLSTVYRTLEIMEKKSLIAKTIIDDGKARYEMCREKHKHHLVCTSCRKMVSIDICPIEAFEKEVRSITEFDITGHRLELFGICPKCKKNE